MRIHFTACIATLLMSTSIAGAQSADPQDAQLAHHHHLLDAAGLPGDSLYQLQIPLETAAGKKLPLSDLRGKPLLITMFYSHCTSICPLITSELQRIDRQLTPKQRSGVRVLMVSFDAERDAPIELAKFERQHHIEDARWVVARAGPGDVRVLAAVLGIRYTELPDHTFNHSAVIALTDREGVVRSRTVGVQAADESFLAQLRALSESESVHH